jgi:CubicO group peptidase (beta-lactamase class C family)
MEVKMNKVKLSAILLSLFLVSNLGALDKENLEKISPEEAGWSSQKLNEAAELADTLGYSAITILYDGKEMFSWGNVRENYKCHSIRKAFLSALYGVYVDNGTIDLDLTIKDLGLDDIPPKLTEREKEATIRQLLQARSGIYHPAAGETSDMEKSRPERGSHPPGTFYYYNNWDFNVLGVIFEKLTGKKIFDAFRTHIADPIGMQDFDPSKCFYYWEREKSEHPKYAFRMSARDMARFGALYQKGGIWNGKRIISERWMKKSTTPYSEKDGAGFGYSWGILLQDTPLAKLIGGSGYFFSGLGVHSLAIIPELKYVLVIRMDTEKDFDFPDRGGNLKMYQMIAASRIKK